MFHPLSVYVGLRYVRARSHTFFVSFITWASLVGVCVGVASLIVILSVMNGFEGELRDRLLSLSAQVRVTATATAPAGAPGVAEWQNAAGSATELARAITQGHLADLTPGSGRIIVGQVIAERLGLAPADSLTVLVPTVDAGGAPAPKLREFTVAGTFEVGLPDHDATLVFAHLADVRALAPQGAASEGLRVRVHDVLAAAAVAARLRALLPGSFEVSDWTQDNANYFRAIRIEKTMMSLILLLIVAVAAFNIVAMLVMVVTDKRTDIAIVRTLGASPRRVMGIFITQGLVIGWLGVALGVVLGLALALHVDTILPFLQRTFRFQILDAEVYYNTAIPAEVHWGNILAIAVAALLLTALATVYPAIRAARTAPAEALRYE